MLLLWRNVSSSLRSQRQRVGLGLLVVNREMSASLTNLFYGHLEMKFADGLAALIREYRLDVDLTRCCLVPPGVEFDVKLRVQDLHLVRRR